MHPLLLFCCVSTLLLSTCQTPAPESPPRQAVPAVRYLEDTRELRGQLLLYEGDSLPVAQPLRFPGQVAFLGSGTQEIVLPDPDPNAEAYRYEATLVTDYPTDLRFTFPGPGGADSERQTIALRMVAPDIAAFPDTIRKAAGIQFTTRADSLRSSENILLFFTGIADGAVRRVMVAGPTRSNRIAVPPGAIDQIAPGDYRLYLIKSQRIDTTTGSLRTAGLIEYYTREKTIRVE
jgi:hypothetical protein